MTVLSIDFETRSAAPLNKCGVWQYATHPTTSILCMAYALDGGEPQLWLPGLPLPEDFADAVGDPLVELRSWNAAFERVLWTVVGERHGLPPVPRLRRWYCTAAEAAAMALPRSLDGAASALRLPVQKDRIGHKLMLRMCQPVTHDPLTWYETPEALQRLAEYCLQDVRTERAVAGMVRRLTPSEQETYWLDQRINDRGLRLDRPLAVACETLALETVAESNALLSLLTDGDVEAVTNVASIAHWLREHGVPVGTGKGAFSRHQVEQYLKDKNLPSDVRRVLTQRIETGRTSVAKLASMLAYAGADDRMRGTLLYHGANTGRWSGRGPQFHNLPRPDIKALATLTVLGEAIRDGHGDYVNAIVPPMTAITSLLRHLIIPSPGHVFVSADAAQIEARLTAWFAGEERLLNDFRSGQDVYQRTADALNTTRQVGKAVVLGCGFGMGAKKFVTMAETAYHLALTEDAATTFVQGYRTLYANVPRLWSALESACFYAVEHRGTPTRVRSTGPLSDVYFLADSTRLWLVLPSKRALCYHEPRIVDRETPWGDVRPQVMVMSVSSFSTKWEPLALYGGQLTENLVQATARDLLVHAMKNVEASGFSLVLTVHDELLAEVPDEADVRHTLDAFLFEVNNIPDWAADCPLKYTGWRGHHYRKE